MTAGQDNGKDHPLERVLQPKEWLRWIADRLGPKWGWLLAVCAVLAAMWWNWPDIRDRPFVQSVVDLWPQPRLPHAQPGKFSVALAHIDNDPNHQTERLIYEALSELPSKSVRVLRFDRLLVLTDSDSQSALDEAHSQARAWLQESHAEVVIWGTVIRFEGQEVPKLHWTAHTELQGMTAFGRYRPVLKDNLDLPPAFWTDLRKVLALLVLNESAQFARKQSHYDADLLRPFIARVRNLIRGSDPKIKWTGEERATLQSILARALVTVGDQSGQNQALSKAIGIYYHVLNEYTRARAPLDWAMTQTNLGLALATLGERELGKTRLEEAVRAYGLALTEYTRERVPIQWAITQNNLGLALFRLGERESDTARLEEAVRAYRAALQAWTRERVPHYWAMAHSNVGAALATPGRAGVGHGPA